MKNEKNYKSMRYDFELWGNRDHGYAIRNTSDFFRFVNDTISQLNTLTSEIEQLKIKNSELQGFIDGYLIGRKEVGIATDNNRKTKTKDSDDDRVH